MEIEERIGRIERISVRIVAAGLLILALAALLLYGTFEFEVRVAFMDIFLAPYVASRKYF